MRLSAERILVSGVHLDQILTLLRLRNLGLTVETFPITLIIPLENEAFWAERVLFGNSASPPPGRYSFTFLRRSALVITETELKLMAAAAKMGLSRIPKNG